MHQGLIPPAGSVRLANLSAGRRALWGGVGRAAQAPRCERGAGRFNSDTPPQRDGRTPTTSSLLSGTFPGRSSARPERRVRDADAGGSNPPAPTTNNKARRRNCCRAYAAAADHAPQTQADAFPRR